MRLYEEFKVFLKPSNRMYIRPELPAVEKRGKESFPFISLKDFISEDLEYDMITRKTMCLSLGLQN